MRNPIPCRWHAMAANGVEPNANEYFGGLRVGGVSPELSVECGGDYYAGGGLLLTLENQEGCAVEVFVPESHRAELLRRLEENET